MKYFNLSILAALLLCVAPLSTTINATEIADNSTAQECSLCQLECQEQSTKCNDTIKKEATVKTTGKGAKQTKESKKEDVEVKKEEVVSPISLETTGVLAFWLAAIIAYELYVNEPIKNQKAAEGQEPSFLVANKNIISSLATIIGGTFIKDPFVDQLKLIRSWTNMKLLKPVGNFFRSYLY